MKLFVILAFVINNSYSAQSDYIIKVFSKEFENQVIKLISNIQQVEFKIAITSEQQPDLKDIRGVYQKAKGNFWVALHKDNVIGTIALMDIGNDQVALRKMFVHKDYRGKDKGIASMLLNTL